jgi:adenosylcobinamide-GDP ribazoletransferase
LLSTGALHEDGLADTADALGGATDRERVMAILKDSRIGTYGAAALILALLLRVTLLARLDAAAPLALVLVGAVSRAAPVWLMTALPYVTAPEASRSRPLVRTGMPQLVVATMFAAMALTGAVCLHAISWPTAAGLAGLCALCALVLGWRFRVRAGGVTGDFLGATQQVGECALLLWLAVVQR